MSEKNEALSKAQKDVAHQRHVLETLINAIPQKVFIKDSSSVYQFCNEAYAADLNIRPEEILGKTDYDFFPHEFAKKYQGDDQKLLARGKGEVIEEGYVHDGKQRWVLMTKAVIPGADGEQGSILGLIHDVTELKEAEKQRSLEQLRYESLLEIAQMSNRTKQEILDFALDKGVALTESEIGYVYFYSEQDEQFTLYSWSKGVMKKCTVVNPQTKYDLVHTGLWGEAVRQRKPMITNNYEKSPYRKGIPEGHVPLTRHLNLPVIQDGEIVAVIGVGNKKLDYDEADIRHLTLLMDGVMRTLEQKKLDDEIRELNQELEARVAERTAELKNTSAALEVLLKEVNHRVKNNLAAIISIVRMEEERFDSSDEVSEASILPDLASRLEGLATVHSLLSAGGWRPLELSKLCEQVVEGALQHLPFDKKISLQVSPSEAKVTSSESHHLTLVLNELATNSVKYCLPERDAGRIEVDIQLNDNQVKLTYQDDGPGYPQALVEGDEGLYSVGATLLRGIVEHSLGGSIVFDNDGGARATITFECEMGEAG